MTKRKVTAKKPNEEGDLKKQKREKDVIIYKILGNVITTISYTTGNPSKKQTC